MLVFKTCGVVLWIFADIETVKEWMKPSSWTFICIFEVGNMADV